MWKFFLSLAFAGTLCVIPVRTLSAEPIQKVTLTPSLMARLNVLAQNPFEEARCLTGTEKNGELILDSMIIPPYLYSLDARGIRPDLSVCPFETRGAFWHTHVFSNSCWLSQPDKTLGWHQKFKVMIVFDRNHWCWWDYSELEGVDLVHWQENKNPLPNHIFKRDGSEDKPPGS